MDGPTHRSRLARHHGPNEREAIRRASQREVMTAFENVKCRSGILREPVQDLSGHCRITFASDQQDWNIEALHEPGRAASDDDVLERLAVRAPGVLNAIARDRGGKVHPKPDREPPSETPVSAHPGAGPLRNWRL